MNVVAANIQSTPISVDPTPDYAEIGITTNFSFLRGGSDPRAYVHQASALRLPIIGIADHNTLAGVVRAYKELGNPEVTYKPKLLIGSRLVFIDGTPDILVYPRDRAAYGRLCRLLTRGKRGDDTEKGECHLTLDDLLEFAEGQLLVLMQIAPKPLLIHCQGGADRSGLAAAIFEYAAMLRPPEQSAEQLSLWYGHFPYLWSRTGAMDDSFSAFVRSGHRIDNFKWTEASR